MFCWSTQGPQAPCIRHFWFCSWQKLDRIFFFLITQVETPVFCMKAAMHCRSSRLLKCFLTIRVSAGENWCLRLFVVGMPAADVLLSEAESLFSSDFRHMYWYISNFGWWFNVEVIVTCVLSFAVWAFPPSTPHPLQPCLPPPFSTIKKKYPH